MTPLLGGRPAMRTSTTNLVHAVRGSDVDLVVIDGTAVAEAGRPWSNADLAELIAPRPAPRRPRPVSPARAEYLAAPRRLTPGGIPGNPGKADHPSRGGFWKVR